MTRRPHHVLGVLALLAVAFALGRAGLPALADAPSGAHPAIAEPAEFAGLVEKLRPVVVNITATRSAPEREIDPFEHFFGPFFRRRPGGPRAVQRALGSGFVVDAAGEVVTNQHVVAGSDEVRVKLADDREFDATVVGRDERLDLALLRLKSAKDLPVAALGSSAAARPGELVLAIGNPFGLGSSVTHGIVSATGRVIGAGPYDDFIQTDASINPGNSGGPLFNTRGEVIGINAIIEAEGRGIGFAIPIDALKEVLPQLRTTGHVARGRLGLTFQPVTPEIAAAIGEPEPRGALVAEVEKAGPAEKAGIKPGDVIVSVNGAEVRHAEELPRMIARHAPDTAVTLGLFRDKKVREVQVTLAKLEEEQPEEPRGGGPAPNGKPRGFLPELGAAVSDAPGGGALITDVAPKGPAGDVLRPGDVIVELNHAIVRGAKELRAMAQAQAGQTALLKVRRGDTSRFVGLALARPPGKQGSGPPKK